MSTLPQSSTTHLWLIWICIEEEDTRARRAPMHGLRLKTASLDPPRLRLRCAPGPGIDLSGWPSGNDRPTVPHWLYSVDQLQRSGER